MQFHRLLVLRMRSQHAQRRRAASALGAATLAARLGLELEANLAVGLTNEVRRKRPPRPCRDERQQVGLARSQELLHLRPLDRSLQDDSTRAKVASPCRTDRALTDVRRRQLEYAAAAFRTR